MRGYHKERSGKSFVGGDTQEEILLCQAGTDLYRLIERRFGVYGKYPCKYKFLSDCDAGTHELLEEVAHIRWLIPANSVDLLVRQPAWSAKWQEEKEKTSSSHSSFHFSHYITGACSRLISHHHALKASIYSRRSFALEWWKEGLTCILEKIPGDCLVTKLWAILLMEADFNANNKIVFGVQMMDVVWQYGLMTEKIYSKQGKTAEDGELAKVFFYDLFGSLWCRRPSAW